MSSKTGARNKGKLGKFLSAGIYTLVGAVCGVLIVRGQVFDMPLPKLALYLAGMFLAMYGAILLEIVLHEAGHLLFGLLSGYGFGSFRIFSFLWIREGDRLRLRRLSLAGTVGQCLMDPPELQDGRMPVFLYNMGGAILNVLSAVLCFGLALLCKDKPALATILQMFSVVGLAMALLNGLPLRVGPVDNDGRNALALARDPQAMRAFWVQMKVMAETARGVRIKDMPEDWFRQPDGDMENSMVATLSALAANRLMDQHRFLEADTLMARLLGHDSVVGLHQGMLLLDRVFVELITKNRPEALSSLQTKAYRSVIKAMKTYPSVLRTQYALALLSERNEAKAKRIREQFDRQSKVYPYPCEIEGERELMEIAAERA